MGLFPMCLSKYTQIRREREKEKRKEEEEEEEE